MEMGWEIRVKRLGLQRSSAGPVRTYGTYQVFIDEQPVTSLFGHICERTGPGDNSAAGAVQHVRIEQGRYALSTQFGAHYRSVGFSEGAASPLPGLLMLGTGARSAILVHPAHPPQLYISSLGDLIPTKPLKAEENMSPPDSRGRVIALIDSLREHDPPAFAKNKIGENTPIADAFIVIGGEPVTDFSEMETV
jgi:hypothetical protein